MKVSDRDEVEAAAATVELDSRHNVEESGVGIRANPGSEMEMGVVGIDQGLTIGDIANGEDLTRVGSLDTDQPDEDLT